MTSLVIWLMMLLVNHQVKPMDFRLPSAAPPGERGTDNPIFATPIR